MKQENILKFRFEGSKKVTELIDTIHPKKHKHTEDNL